MVRVMDYQLDRPCVSSQCLVFQPIYLKMDPSQLLTGVDQGFNNIRPIYAGWRSELELQKLLGFYFVEGDSERGQIEKSSIKIEMHPL